MSYRRYAEYKDSGVEWLGEVPEHWAVIRIKFVANLNPSKSEVRLLPKNELVTFIPMKSIGDKGELDVSQSKLLSEVLNNYTYLAENDVIIAKITPCFENGKGAIATGLLNGIGFATTEVIPLRCKTKLINKFIYYLLSSEPFKGLGEGSMYGAGGQKRVADSFVANYRFSLPSKNEQRQIATFLDKETAKIDTLISKQQRLIELLKEKRQAVISHAVTKGLNPDVKMKDSGIEWLGEVPEHWDILRNRRVIKTIEQGWSPQADNRPPSVDEWGVTKLSSVKQGKFNPKESKTLYPDDDPSHGIIVKEGDFLLTRANTPKLVGDVCVVPALEHHKLLLCDLIYRVRFSASIEPKFLSAFFLSVSGRTQVKMDARGTSMSMAKISQGHIKDWLVPVPPIEEQIRIVDYLNSQTKKIAQTIDTAKRAIKLLKERRTALISAAVTGKIDVRSPRLALS